MRKAVLRRREMPPVHADVPNLAPMVDVVMCILIFFNTGVGRWLDRGVVKEGLFVYQPLGIVLTQFIVGCAFAIRVVKAGFEAFDWRYEDAAMTLGATANVAMTAEVRASRARVGDRRVLVAGSFMVEAPSGESSAIRVQ